MNTLANAWGIDLDDDQIRKGDVEVSEEHRDGFWATVEIMGHQQYAGFVSEQIMGGASFIRVDVPSHGDCAAFSKMFGAQSIYCITPVTEEVALGVCMRLEKQPMTEWALPDSWQQAIRQGRLLYEDDEQQNF